MDMDIFVDHSLQYAHEIDLKFRHDLVRDVLFDICFRGIIQAQKKWFGFLIN